MSGLAWVYLSGWLSYGVPLWRQIRRVDIVNKWRSQGSRDVCAPG
jgi:hypothetical protein